MNRNFLVPEIKQHANQDEQKLEQQRVDAVVIAIDPWFREQSALTALDYMEEMGIANVAAAPVMVARTGTAQGEFQKRLESLADMNFTTVTEYHEYLDEIVHRREKGSTLIQWESESLVGFVDHEKDYRVVIAIQDIRRSRREAKNDPRLMEIYESLAKPLHLEDAAAVIGSSWSPGTRAYILGPAEYGLQAGFIDDDVVQTPLTNDVWDSDSIVGSFAKEVPEIGGERPVR